MPPKKDDKAGVDLVGFEPKEAKLLAAAFVASIGVDKYDYDLMATLTGYTAGSLKKMWPPIKRKACEDYPSFAGYLAVPITTSATSGTDLKAAPKTAAPKADALKAAGGKRKAVSEPTETKLNKDGESPNGTEANGNVDDKKKAPARGRGRPKKVKVEKEPTPEESVDKDEDAEDDI